MTTKLTTPAYEIPNFSYSDDRLDRGNGWEVAMIGGVHRDSNLLDRCNAESILAALADIDPEQTAHDTMRARHWAVGWYNHLLVDTRNSAIMACLASLADRLDTYPILDEDMHSEAEHNEAQESWESYGRSDFKRLLVIALQDTNPNNADELVYSLEDAQIDECYWSLDLNCGHYHSDDSGINFEYHDAIPLVIAKLFN